MGRPAPLRPVPVRFVDPGCQRGSSYVTPTVLTKATTSLLGMACEAAGRLGAVGVLILPEGPMDWAALRASYPDGRLLVAVSLAKQIEAVRGAGLIALE